MSDAGGTWVHVLLILLRCFSQEKGLQERGVGEEGAAWHGHVNPALLCSPSGQCSALLGCVVRAAAGENTEQQQQPWDLNHFCSGHFGLRGSIWACPRPKRGVTFCIVWVGTFSLCLCCVVAVFGGMWGHSSSFPFPAAALCVEAIKEAPF